MSSIVLASSRGKGLAGLLPADTIISVRPGAMLSQLRREAESAIPPNHSSTKKRRHFYFLCGIPNLTRLLKSSNYRECIFDEEPSNSIDKYCRELKECQKSLLRRGALPIFATIARANLQIYNNHFIEKRIYISFG